MKPAKHLIRQAFNGAAASYDAAADVQRQACRTLARRLPGTRTTQTLLDAGCGTGFALALLRDRFPAAARIALDHAPAMLARARTTDPAALALGGDLEHLPLATASLDLYWSSLAVQWCDLARSLAEAARVLRPGGRLLLATLGQRTFAELRQAFAASDRHRHTLDFLPAGAIAPLALAARFSDIHVEHTPVVTHHADLPTLLRAVKAIGANQVGAGRRTGLMSRTAFARASEAYESLRQPAGLPLTYDLIYLEATR